MVKKRFLLPQEIEVHYIIPTLKRYLSQIMKAQGKKQVEIAQLLSIQEATVSQYLSSKRGHQINFTEQIQKEIEKSAQKIKDQSTLIYEIQRLLHLIKGSGTLCQVHKQFSLVPHQCSLDMGAAGCK